MVNERVLRVPLVHYRVRGVEQVLVRAMLTLMVRVGPKRLEELEVLVDTGTPLTTIPVAVARKAGLVIPTRKIELELVTATGKARQIRHPGRIQGKIMGLDGWDFDWPCHFAEHDGPPPTAQLGPVGVIDNFRLTFDGQYSLESPHGWLIVERTT